MPLLRQNSKTTRVLFAAALCLLPVQALCAQTAKSDELVDRAQKQVVNYLSKLADLHCTENVKQQKLLKSGHVEATSRSKFDYFILIQGASGEFQLAESRLEQGSDKAKNTPMLLTNGFSSMLLVFHPYYRDSFNFSVGNAVNENGRSVVPVSFTHIPGTRSPAGLALRDREYALDLTGTAYIDAKSAEVLRIESGLSHDMSDIGIKTLHVEVEYKPFKSSDEQVMLPEIAKVELETPKQHWRNEHLFTNYRAFTADAEQSADVTIHKDKSKTEGNEPTKTPENAPAAGKEKQ
jgi:hypothetical protein